MHVWGISVDLDSIAPFLFTAFLIFYGLVYVVKNTASKYFVVDASFEAGGGIGGGGGGGEESSVGNTEEKEESLCGKIRVDPVMTVDLSCVVCGEYGSKQCSLCKAVRYCTLKCQRKHWTSGGHQNDCKKVLVPNGDRSLRLKKVLFPYEEFVKLYNWNNPGFPPRGLRNCGNSCFANVVLQCLTYTKPLTAYLLEKGHRSECKKTEWCFLCEFETHLDRASRSIEPFSPFNILSRLPHIGGNLGFGKQEDAHEFMRFAIDSMQSVLLDQFGGEKALHLSSQETTLIQYIFGGHLLSQVKCITCSKVSNRYENMMDLTVEIHGDNESLQECLVQFTTPEWLDGENKYKCDGCDAYVTARKQLSIQQPPNILTIALKRFQGGRFGKLNKRVTFPEILDLSPYMTNAVDGSDVYNLYAVVVHIDMLNASYFGHYICYIKDFRGDWYRIDDCKVVDVDVDEVLSAAAYMLLYCRNRPRESHQIPSEPSKGPEPVGNLESCSKSFQSVATSASVNPGSSWGTHMPVKLFSACDNRELDSKDEATSKYASYKHENGRADSLSPSNGVGIHDNGHSDQGSDSGCSSSTDKVSLCNGNEQHSLGSKAQSPLWDFQGCPEEELNDVIDLFKLCDGVRFPQKKNGDTEHSEKRPANRKKDVSAESGLSDACSTNVSKQRKEDDYEGLFRRGFLNQNGNKLKKKVNENISDPPPVDSMLNNGNCCSSVVDAASTGGSSPKEKLDSDVEEMLCDDVKEHMGIDQEVTLPSIDEGHLHTASVLPSSPPDLPSVGNCRSGNNEHERPCNGNYFSADSAECAKDIQVVIEVAPSLPNVEHSPENGSLEGTLDDSNTDRNYFSADSNECSKNIQIDVKLTPSSPKAEHSSANGSSAKGMCDDSSTDQVNGSPSESRSLNGKLIPSVETIREAPASLSEQVGNNGILVTPSSTSSLSSGDSLCSDGEIRGGSAFCCNDGMQQ